MESKVCLPVRREDLVCIEYDGTPEHAAEIIEFFDGDFQSNYDDLEFGDCESEDYKSLEAGMFIVYNKNNKYEVVDVCYVKEFHKKYEIM